MPRNSQGTRDRLLAAAVKEFAEHGLAGGRIERITTAAGANPKSLYTYFRSKRALFDAAVTEVLGGLGKQAPLTPEDLPGYAARSFDWIVAHPEAVRLNLWRNLEARDTGPDDSAHYRNVVAGMRGNRTATGTLDPADLIVLVATMASAWVTTSRDMAAADGRALDDPARVADHRAALVEAVRRVVGSPAPPQADSDTSSVTTSATASAEVP